MTPSILEWVGFKRIGDIGDHIISVSDLGQFGFGVSGFGFWVWGFKRIGDIGDHIISVSDLGQSPPLPYCTA